MRLRFALFGSLLLLAIPSVSLAAPAPLATPTYQMLDGVNRLRAEAGAAPLVMDPSLASLAFDRSVDMLGRDYFSHDTPDGQSIFDLLDQRAIGFQVAGENIAWNTGSEAETSAIALRGFQNSPPHRANILSPEFSQIGIGVAAEGGKTYFTLVFKG